MATRYVWSGATGSGTGADWTNAYTTLAAAVTAAAAGDGIRVAHDHDEVASSSAAVNYSLPGTRTNPVQLLSVNRTSELVEKGALVKTSGAYAITLTQSSASGASYVRGMEFRSGVGASTTTDLTINRQKWFRDCTFTLATTGGGYIKIADPSEYLLENCTIGVASGTGSLYVGSAGVAADVVWRGGGVATGYNGALLAYFAVQGSTAAFSALDLGALPVGSAIFSAGADNCYGIIRDSKLPTGWSGSLHSGAVPYACRFGMYNCDAGDTNYNLVIRDYAGDIVDETAIYRTDGFKLRDQSNAAIGYSLKLTTNSNTHELIAPLKTDPLIRNYPGTTAEQAAFSPGASKTVTVEITHSAAAALTDAQAWLEVDYLGTDGSPLGVIARNRRISTLATAAAQPTSTEAWSGTAQTYKQKLSVTITPQAPGVIEARVCLATGNGVIVYVDPMITVS